MLSFMLFVALGAAQAADAADTVTDEAAAAATDEAAAAASETAVASAEPSGQRLICRSRPVLGSRITRQRICKTADDWRIYENDLEASRRDINDRGMRGCSGRCAE